MAMAANLDKPAVDDDCLPDVSAALMRWGGSMTMTALITG